MTLSCQLVARRTHAHAVVRGLLPLAAAPRSQYYTYGRLNYCWLVLLCACLAFLACGLLWTPHPTIIDGLLANGSWFQPLDYSVVDYTHHFESPSEVDHAVKVACIGTDDTLRSISIDLSAQHAARSGRYGVLAHINSSNAGCTLQSPVTWLHASRLYSFCIWGRLAPTPGEARWPAVFTSLSLLNATSNATIVHSPPPRTKYGVSPNAVRFSSTAWGKLCLRDVQVPEPGVWGRFQLDLPPATGSYHMDDAVLSHEELDMHWADEERVNERIEHHRRADIEVHLFTCTEINNSHGDDLGGHHHGSTGGRGGAHSDVGSLVGALPSGGPLGEGTEAGLGLGASTTGAGPKAVPTQLQLLSPSSAVENVSVVLEQHEFLFGTAFDMAAVAPDDRQWYLGTVKELFNSITTAFRLFWSVMEPLPQRHYEGRNLVHEILKFAEESGMRRVHGHTLEWNHHRYAPDHWPKLDGCEAYLERLKRRVKRTVGIFTGRFHSYDTLNEAFHQHRYLESCGLYPGVIADIHRWAAEADPRVSLCLNEPNVLGGHDNRLEEMMHTVRWMQAHQVPVHCIGLQAYIKPNFLTPERMKQQLDTLAGLGLPLYISEFLFREGPVYNVSLLSEQQTADAFARWVPLWFSHPALRGVTVWGFWEERIEIPGAALFHANKSEKAAGRVWRELVKVRWNTTVTAVAGAAAASSDGLQLASNGRSGTSSSSIQDHPSSAVLRFRGFYGRYRYMVTLRDGRQYSGMFNALQENAPCIGCIGNNPPTANEGGRSGSRPRGRLLRWLEQLLRRLLSWQWQWQWQWPFAHCQLHKSSSQSETLRVKVLLPPLPPSSTSSGEGASGLSGSGTGSRSSGTQAQCS